MGEKDDSRSHPRRVPTPRGVAEASSNAKAISRGTCPQARTRSRTEGVENRAVVGAFTVGLSSSVGQAMCHIELISAVIDVPHAGARPASDRP